MKHSLVDLNSLPPQRKPHSHRVGHHEYSSANRIITSYSIPRPLISYRKAMTFEPPEYPVEIPMSKPRTPYKVSRSPIALSISPKHLA